MPDVPAPEALPDVETYLEQLAAEIPTRVRLMLQGHSPFEFRPVRPPLSFLSQPEFPPKNVWFRAVDRLPDDPVRDRSLLAYVSDFNLLDTATMQHGVSMVARNLVVASIDHAMWFHRRARLDDWLLYSTDSPSAGGARGFTRGSIFSRDGRLVASTCQEGLIRLVDP